MQMPHGSFAGREIEEIPLGRLFWILMYDHRGDALLIAAILDHLQLAMFPDDESRYTAASTALDEADHRRIRTALKDAYRKASFKYHPARGGSMEAMKAVNDLYDTFIEILDDSGEGPTP